MLIGFILRRLTMAGQGIGHTLHALVYRGFGGQVCRRPIAREIGWGHAGDTVRLRGSCSDARLEVCLRCGPDNGDELVHVGRIPDRLASSRLVVPGGSNWDRDAQLNEPDGVKPIVATLPRR